MSRRLSRLAVAVSIALTLLVPPTGATAAPTGATPAPSASTAPPAGTPGPPLARGHVLTRRAGIAGRRCPMCSPTSRPRRQRGRDSTASLPTRVSSIDTSLERACRFIPGGVLEQAGDRIELALVQPKDVSRLQKAGENYFTAGKSGDLSAADDRRVKIGYLEMSGVNPVEEMVELITASRAYEANVRIIQQHDTATSELISRMLKV